jgi:hypothetical protein
MKIKKLYFFHVYIKSHDCLNLACGCAFCLWSAMTNDNDILLKGLKKLTALCEFYIII